MVLSVLTRKRGLPSVIESTPTFHFSDLDSGDQIENRALKEKQREGRTYASTKTCPERDCSATGLSIIFRHIAWVLGTKSHTLRRGLSYDRFLPTVSISKTEIAQKK